MSWNFIGVRSMKDIFLYLLGAWIGLLIIGIFIFKNEISAPISLVLIALIIITIIAYILGRKHWKKRFSK